MAQHMKPEAEAEYAAEAVVNADGFDDFASKEKTKAIVSGIAVLIVNLAAYLFGINLDSGIIVDAIMGVIILGTTVYAAYKNHNYTRAAAAGQQVLNQVKADDGTA